MAKVSNNQRQASKLKPQFFQSQLPNPEPTVMRSSPLPMIHRSLRRDSVKFRNACEKFARPSTIKAVTSCATSLSLPPRAREGRAKA
ncbi:hypothetical protein PspLS_07594 [Pyricularia sp. CBS 133598]|nr:hypothetical protein PspLS_07594 [Pyricularia sp. CBS 133598]